MVSHIKSVCRNISIPLLAILSLSYLLAPSTLLSAETKTDVQFGPQGLRSIQVNGKQILETGTPRLRRVVFRRQDHSTYRGKLENAEESFEEEKKIYHMRYEWGAITCNYQPRNNRLDLSVRVTNRSRHTLHLVDMNVLTFHLAKNLTAGPSRHNVGAPTVIPAKWDGGTMVLCNLEMDRPLRLALQKRKSKKLTTNLTAGGEKMIYDALYLRRPIAPGKSDRYQISIRFGSAGSDPLDLAADVFRTFRQTHPRLLNWHDRSPITRHFFGGGLDKKKILNYFKDPKSVELPRATEKFRKRILSAIDRNIAASKKIGAQAIIIWDIEGNSFPHPTTYIGDPRLTKILNPVMDDVADEMFEHIREAGLKPGVCIRPTQVKYVEKENKVVHRHTPVLEKYPRDPVFHQLDAKIQYAKERWGCEVFYIDTPFFWRPRGPKDKWSAGMIQAEVWEKLLKKHPDILMIPEFHYLEQLAYDALGRIGGKEATAALIRCLKNEPGIYTRCSAANALARTGRPEARDALKKVRADARKNKKLHHLAWCIGRALNRME
ncbi:MAG: HEAT repeat domain-containing protein [Candidatus Brocadiia bacterium]